MALQKNHLLALNRGIVSALGLCRIDTERMAYSAEDQTNVIPRVLGSAMLRPGWEHLGATRANLSSRLLPFVFSADDTAMLEINGGNMRVWLDDEVVERPAVTGSVTNGTFTGSLTGWTDIDEAGTSSTHDGVSRMVLQGNGTNFAGRKQEVTVNETGSEHALLIEIRRGPVLFKVGSTDGGDEYVTETELETGVHSLAFTPSGNFWIYFRNNLSYSVQVDSIAVESSGVMDVETPIGTAFVDRIRTAQSADVIFAAASQFHPMKIERRGTRSWSVVLYKPKTGPFRQINVSNVTLAPSALTGDITITASKPVFDDEHLDGGIFGGPHGALFRIASVGQDVGATITAEDSFSDPIRVVGVDDSRIFNIVITGSFTATVTVQYSVGEPGAWVDLATTYNSATTTTHDDGLDNQIIYYRIGVKTGDYTSGTVNAQLTIASGSITGAAMVTAVTSSTQVSAVVLKAFGGTAASKDWWEGAWSAYRGYPSAVSLHEGRLWWAGEDKIYGSVSDAYEDFDDFVEGDSGPILRNIGFGPVENIFWLMSLQRLLMGTASNSTNTSPAVIDGNSVIAARSTGFDEPLTPTNFNLRAIYPTGLFVDRSGQRLYSLEFDGNDYVPSDLTLIAPDLNEVGINYIAVQMKPDVRIHCVRADGKASVLVFDRAENVAAWIEVETDGDIEQCAVLPGSGEDQVYYVVKRTIDGSTVRYIEKWAKESDCQGGTLNKQADAFFEYSGSSTTSISGLDHLEGESVVIWANGKSLGTKTVSSGSITGLSESVTSAIVGLTYRARFKGAKLASMFKGGLNQKQKIAKVGLNLLNTHHKGLRFGPSFDEMYDMPQTKDEKPVPADTVHDEYTVDLFAYGGNWSDDSRVHLEMNAPLPCTIQALSLVVDG